MARRYARIKVTIWGDRDFRKLSSAAQRLYLLLASSPESNLCGVTDWRPARIAKLAADTTPKDIEDAGIELVEAGYVVIADDDTEEALVRSFIRHDEGIKTPNIAAAVAKDYSAVYSETLQGVIVHELNRLKEDEPGWKGWASPIQKVLGNPSVNPSDLKVLGKGSGNPSGKGSGKASHIPQPSTLNQKPSSIREDIGRICEHLATRIEGNGSKRPDITKSWKDAARLLVDRDGRTEEQIHRCIDWCQDDEFWRSNILSMPKLREKYDQLRLKATEKKPEQRSVLPGGDSFTPPPPADDMPGELFAAWNRAHNEAHRDGRPGPEDWHELEQAS